MIVYSVLIWHLNSLSVRVQHIIKLLIYFLKPIINILFLLLAVFDIC
jgi:hypothetical protein